MFFKSTLNLKLDNHLKELAKVKVLLNDGLEKEGLKIFQDAGIETDTQKRDIAKLIADIDGFDALIVRSATKVTKEIIEKHIKQYTDKGYDISHIHRTNRS